FCCIKFKLYNLLETKANPSQGGDAKLRVSGQTAELPPSNGGMRQPSYLTSSLAVFTYFGAMMRQGRKRRGSTLIMAVFIAIIFAVAAYAVLFMSLGLRQRVDFSERTL